MDKNLFSVILMSYQSEQKIHSVYRQVTERLEMEKIPFEFIIMDDGSKDNSYNIALEIEKTDKRVRAFQLSKNFTTHYAKFAAFSVCNGACATSIPDDLQLPLDVVVKMYRMWEQGHKIVVPFRMLRDDGKLNDFFSNLYYKIMNSISEVKFPPGGADGFLVDREVIDIINTKVSPKNTSSIIEVLRLGFDPVFIPFERPKSSGKSRWTLKKKIRLAMDTILSSSSFPIKMIVFLGLFSVFFSVILILTGAFIRLFLAPGFLGFAIPGWTTNLVLLSFFSGLILFSLGIIAEYIWRIHEEVKGRPGFIIRKKESKEGN